MNFRDSKPELKSERLVIRCRSKTKRRFKMFIADHSFRTEEDALAKLLEIAEAQPTIVWA